MKCDNQISAKIAVKENDLLELAARKNDEDRLYSDLTGLYADIIRAIGANDGTKSLIIYDYAKLLLQELQLYSGVEAFYKGENAKDSPVEDILREYLCEVSQKNNSLGLEAKILVLYNDIANLLSNSRGLLDDFTEAYSHVHGVIKNNIHEFIRLGQNADRLVKS